MKKLTSILMAIALFATLSFAQASGKASDQGKDSSAKATDKSGKKGHKGGKKGHHKGGKMDKDVKGGDQK